MLTISLVFLANEIENIQARFVESSSSGKYLNADDQAEFKGLSVRAKTTLDTELGIANDFSPNLVSSINAGSGGFFGGPSCVCIGEVVAIIRGEKVTVPTEIDLQYAVAAALVGQAIRATQQKNKNDILGNILN